MSRRGKEMERVINQHPAVDPSKEKVGVSQNNTNCFNTKKSLIHHFTSALAKKCFHTKVINKIPFSFSGAVSQCAARPKAALRHCKSPATKWSHAHHQYTEGRPRVGCPVSWGVWQGFREGAGGGVCLTAY